MNSLFNSALKSLGLKSSKSETSKGLDIKTSTTSFPGDSGFVQWHDAMRMVARLPGGIPQEFRKRLWLTLGDRHLQKQKIDWETTKKLYFNEKTNSDDDRLGSQIIKDLHRTGCSMFSGEEAELNQALLKRVLLAYARWNKTVGYCQGFNMLAAIILEVMEWKEDDSLKVMIFLIEGVLPEGYFANHLRGLSVDMAVVRDLLRMRLICLSRHLDKLQVEARDSSTGASYEPPLTNVFTMQWFLTLFSTCLPKSTVLQVWDLMFLEGNEILLRTALAIWDGLADRIMTVESADEFYSIMGVLTREMVEFGLMDPNDLIKTICTMSQFPYPQLVELREKYMYNIRPLTSSLAPSRRGLHLIFSDDEDDNDEEQLVVATWCLSSSLPVPRLKGDNSRTPSPSTSSNFTLFGPGSSGLLTSPSANAERVVLDMSALKKHYSKLRERQKQAHIILTGSFHQPSNKTKVHQPVAVNHLLLGKKPLIRKQKEASQTTLNLKNPLVKANSGLRNRHHKLKSTGRTRSNLVLQESGQTLTWEQAKKEKKKHRVTMETARRQLLHNIPQTVEGKARGMRREEVDFEGLPEKDNEESGSSTSTELCDEDGPEVLSEYSSPEMGRKVNNAPEPLSLSTCNLSNVSVTNEESDLSSGVLRKKEISKYQQSKDESDVNIVESNKDELSKINTNKICIEAIDERTESFRSERTLPRLLLKDTNPEHTGSNAIPVILNTKPVATVSREMDTSLFERRQKQSTNEKHANVSFVVPNLTGDKEGMRTLRSMSESGERRLDPEEQMTEKLEFTKIKSSLPKEVSIQRWADSSPKRSQTKSSQFSPAVRSCVGRKSTKEIGGKFFMYNIVEDKLTNEQKGFSNVVRPSRNYNYSENH